MKNKDIKGGKESIIGKIIYGFLLFMPLLAIATTCLYAIFNKNAYKSYSDQYVESSVNLDSSNINTLYVDGQNITYTFTEHNTQWNAVFGFSEISIDLNELFNTDTSWNKFYLYKDNEDILFFTTSNQTYRLNEVDRDFDTFTYKVDLTVATDKEIYNYGIATIINYSTNKVSDVFYYAVDKTEQSELFNWSKNSIIYTGVNATCNELKITNTFIPMLLTYWLLISVIYILYDIILMILIILHNRIHRLQDSMS